MQHIIKYALVAMIGAGVVALVSLLWPKFTVKPEPQALEQVRSTVLGTEIGQNAANLLGVANNGGQVLNLSDTASSVAGAITSSVEERVQSIIAEQIAAQVVKQYEQLPAAQQTHVTEIICKP